ncbi:MAG: BlaI/MecI/CopY family transcriptional regulator [candidate division Zixibacteria bacterium]|nr:BlaI/MecI/CopY family transcriptional regulator [candidate division Zixibacteria bacterium]
MTSTPFLTRLIRKGLLTKEKSGRSYVYRPALDRATFVRRRVKTVSDCLHGNFKNIRL